jgi:hypothetical protein
MPVWVWILFVVCVAYCGFVLRRAWNRHYFKYGPIIYSLEETPIYFWFFAVVFSICELFFVALLTLGAISAIWGPVFHQ